MTIGLPQLWQLADRAMMGVPHVNAAETCALLRYLTDTQREQAMRCYASLIGERTLPVNAGRSASPHARQAPAARRDDARQSRPSRPAPYNYLTVKRAAAARRELEARRDLEQA